jgi:hypothetical protein
MEDEDQVTSAIGNMGIWQLRYSRWLRLVTGRVA